MNKRSRAAIALAVVMALTLALSAVVFAARTSAAKPRCREDAHRARVIHYQRRLDLYEQVPDVHAQTHHRLDPVIRGQGRESLSGPGGRRGEVQVEQRQLHSPRDVSVSGCRPGLPRARRCPVHAASARTDRPRNARSAGNPRARGGLRPGNDQQKRQDARRRISRQSLW